ncbi:MAG: protein kinase, partial [Myxococcota bacterium]
MSIELIRGELERLYSLDQMLALSNDLLGFRPENVGGTASVASFARALTQHCEEVDAIAALIDAVVVTRDDASPKLQAFADDVLRSAVDLKEGSTFDAFTIRRRLGAGPNGTVYTAEKESEKYVVKVLHNAATHDRTSLHRFLTRNRLLARVQNGEGTHDHLPVDQTAGYVDGKAYVAYRAIEAKPLAPRIRRTGALHINEARPIIHGILEALKTLHDSNLVHGAIKLENVLVANAPAAGERRSPVRVFLIDAGGDLLSSSWVHSDVKSSGGDRIKGLAPEQLQGLDTTTKSDLYGFGALLFEI